MASLIQTQEFQGADQNESVLTEQQKKLYKKYLATGDFDKIRNEFSPLYLKRAFSYVGKKYSWQEEHNETIGVKNGLLLSINKTMS